MLVYGESKKITFRESIGHPLFILFTSTSWTFNIWLTIQLKSFIYTYFTYVLWCGRHTLFRLFLHLAKKVFVNQLSIFLFQWNLKWNIRINKNKSYFHHGVSWDHNRKAGGLISRCCDFTTRFGITHYIAHPNWNMIIKIHFKIKNKLFLDHPSFWITQTPVSINSRDNGDCSVISRMIPFIFFRMIPFISIFKHTWHFLFLKIFFWCGPFLESLLNLLQYCFFSFFFF